MREILLSETGRKAVCISANDSTGPFTAYVYVNCNPVFPDQLGDITLVSKKAKRIETVRAWGRKQLS